MTAAAGDGDAMLTHRLATLADLNLPVAVLVCNNAHLGLVRQQQQLFYGGRYSASKLGAGTDFGLAGADAAGDVQAGLGAGDVEEAGAVGVANLHVVNSGRSGFARQVGSVSARGDHQAGGGAEQRLHVHFLTSKSHLEKEPFPA